MSTIREVGETLLADLCSCITEYTLSNPDFLTQCTCFMNDKEGDLCCNAAFYWGGQIPLCAGAFVSFMGTEMDEFSSSPCNSMKTGVFLVGVTLCPPDNDAKASLIADYGDCLFQLAEHLSACLVGCLCEERDTVISGVRSDPEGMFFEVRKRITNPVA